MLLKALWNYTCSKFRKLRPQLPELGLNIYFLLILFYIYLTSFILPHTKCFRIFTDFPKPSCCSINSCSNATWELQIAFLKPPQNLCTLLRRLFKSHSHAALKKQLNTIARRFWEICENSKLLDGSDINFTYNC